MHLTIIGMVLTLTASLSNPTVSSDTPLQTISSIANIVYVGLTVVIVIAAIWSNALTRKQMNENKTQSEAALAASAKQSQDAIDAVHEQIKASEKQSQAAIDAIHKQIEENKNQTLETIHNQHRPLLVCTHPPVPDTSLQQLPMPIKNVGVGITLNIRVVLSYASNTRGEKLQSGFIISSVLAPGEAESIFFDPQGMRNMLDKIGEYSFFPEDPDTSYNQRLVITYQDIFSRKHLSIFDGRLSTNWKPYVIEPNFKYGIDDVCPDWTFLGKKELNVTYSKRIY